jgi:hypothetical protein
LGGLLRAIAFILGALSIGCTVSAEDAAAEDDYPGEDDLTHAIVRIQQTTGAQGSARGDALAGFVQIPAGADASQILGLAGLTDALPPKGECWSGPDLGDSGELLQVSRAELVEADSVELVTESGNHSLAPYAFPTVADLLRGVVYLSRDRATELPADGAYTIVGRGIEGGGASSLDVTSEHTSPPFVGSVQINGAPLEEGMGLSAGPVIDLTWEGSDTDGDLIVVTVENPGVVWTCSFADSEEFGSIPLLTVDGTALGQDGQQAALGIHRIRSSTSTPGGGLARLTVTFDFALEAGVRFSDGATE